MAGTELKVDLRTEQGSAAVKKITQRRLDSLYCLWNEL